MENITKSWKNEELPDVNSVTVSVAAMPYGLWQGSLLLKQARGNNLDARSLFKLCKGHCPHSQLSLTCRDCIFSSCRLSEAFCQGGNSETSMYTYITWGSCFKMKIMVQYVWGGTWNSASLANSQKTDAVDAFTILREKV